MGAHLRRDVALIGAAVLVVGAAIGTGIGIAIDVLIHRHTERSHRA